MIFDPANVIAPATLLREETIHAYAKDDLLIWLPETQIFGLKAQNPSYILKVQALGVNKY